MFELSLNILDLVQNSITAGAMLVTIGVCYDEETRVLTIVIADDGCGMDEALLKRVTSPFATTRTTRRVGLGIPMFKQTAELCAGTFGLVSEPGEGTTLTATFSLDSIDLPPLGDLSGTMRSLVLGAPDRPDFKLSYRVNQSEFTFDTRAVREALGGVSLSEPDVLGWIGEYISQGMAECDAVRSDTTI